MMQNRRRRTGRGNEGHKQTAISEVLREHHG